MKKDTRVIIKTKEKSLSDIHESIFSYLTGEAPTPESRLTRDVIDYYNNIIRCMPGNVYWLDTKCRTVGCNQNVLTMFNLDSMEAFYGLSFEEMAEIGQWTEQQAESFKHDTEEVIRTGQRKANIEEPPIPGTDGKLIYFLTTRVPLFNVQGKVIGVVGISTDITDRKQLEEELRAALAVKSEFIANMSHDIRTPITGILGLTQALMDQAADIQKQIRQAPPQSEAEQTLQNHIHHINERTQEYGELLLSATTELLELNNEILEIARLDSGHADEEPEIFYLQEPFIHNIRLLRPVAKHKGLDLFLEIDPRLPEQARGHRIYLDRIILNLLSNSLKFTETGFVRLSLELGRHDSMPITPGETIDLIMTVEDTGAGIPKDKHEEIFEHFSRLSASYHGVYKGSGLGLYAVRRYLDAMHGHVQVDSAPGEGSRFIITVPLTILGASKHPLTPTTPHPTQAPPTQSQQRRSFRFDSHIRLEDAAARILVVEDNWLAAVALKSLLIKLKCYIDIAENGKTALTMVANHHYDLIFMDIGLPDTNGYDLAKVIRQHSKQHRSIPIVALTGHATEEVQQHCLAANIKEVLSKPAQLKTLKNTLKQHIPTLKL